MTVELTRFFGRRQELDQVADLMRNRRLVTLTGLGGAGKTRLALKLCEQTRSSFPEGTWLVDLGPVVDGVMLGQRVASTLDVTTGPGADPMTAVTSRLGTRRLLLVLDTCEHLIDHVGETATRLLANCPRVVVLATSRQPLGIPGEAVYELPPLGEEAAAALFADRAALVQPRFDPEAAHTDVAAICTKVDQMPLGVELAAGWAGTLSPTEISAGLEDALGLLTGGPRSQSARHRTLRASLAWSYDLLTGDEQAFFRRLGVFPASFGADAARAVAAGDGHDNHDNHDDHDHTATLQLLRRLRAVSLLTSHDSPTGTRYRMLDTVRQFALDQLTGAGETETVRDRHLDHHLQLAERAERGLDDQQDTWRETLQEQHEDITAALRWGLVARGGTSTRVQRARRLAAAMARHWMLTGNTAEGLDFLARADTGPARTRAAAGDRTDEPADTWNETPPQNSRTEKLLRSRLAAGTAMVGMVGGRRALVTEAAQRGLAAAEHAGDAGMQARCRMMLAYPLFFTDFAKCHSLVTAAGEDGSRAGDAFVRDWSKVLEGYTQQTRGHHREAIAAARAAVAGALPRGDRFTAAFGLGVQLFVTMVSGHVDEAIRRGRESVALATPLRDYFAVGTNTVNAALPIALSGDLEAAHRLMDPVAAALQSAPPADVVGLMVPFGYAALWGGDLDTALQWFRQAVEPGEDGILDWTAGRCLPGLVKALRHRDDDNAIREAAWAVQVERAFHAPYELAQALDEHGHLLRPTDPHRAHELHHDALALRIRHGIRLGYVDSLDALAHLEADAGNPAQATRLLAASAAGRRTMHYPIPAVDQADHDHTLTQLRGTLGTHGFDRAWHDGLAWDLDQAVTVISRGRGPRRRPMTGWDSLTPTEREVVALVVAGLPNPQIAQRLAMSRSTVKTHLTHIYAKVGVTNRTQLAAANRHRPHTNSE